MSTFPLPMPVMHNVQIFPHFFTTDKELGLAYLPLDEQIQALLENRTFFLQGSLCFMLISSLQDKSQCISLHYQSAAWLRKSSWGVTTDIKADTIVIRGWWPSRKPGNKPPSQPRMAPFCKEGSMEDVMLPWTGCQAKKYTWAVEKYFSFSPYISREYNDTFAGYDFSTMDPLRTNTNPFDQWLLCGVNGSCTDLAPMAMIGGGSSEKGELTFDWKSTLKTGRSDKQSPNSFKWTTSNVRYKKQKEVNFTATPVCVWPPFLWVVSNTSLNQNQIEIDCSQEKCFYALCWDAKKYPFALVTRMPRFVPVPVDAPNSLTLFRGKRDFGISAIIVGLVATAAVAASVTASALALSTTVQTTQTINELSMTVTMALDKQATANSQIQGGLMLINQRIDLVQEQVDILWQLAQLGCEYKMPGLCVTSVQFENSTRAANLSKTLSRYMLQNWTMEFEQTLRELRVAILQVNSMRLDPSLTKGFSTWISSAFSYFKEWVGVGLFAVILCGGTLLLLWMVCKLKAQTKRDKMVIAQALAALEHGASPDIWLSILKQ